jgi:hypothetical protein
MNTGTTETFGDYYEVDVEKEYKKLIKPHGLKGRPASKREQTPQEKANWFKKGESNRGRPRGTPNKSIAIVKDTIALIVNKNIDRVDKVLSKIAKDDPARYVEIVIKLSEFVTPKISRQEHSGEVQHTNLIIGLPKDLQLPAPINNTIDIPSVEDNLNQQHND